MAGYIIYSLDWQKFLTMLDHPTSSQLAIFAEGLSVERENLDGEFDDDDPILNWPTDIGSLSSVIADRLALSDWYSDLSEQGRQLWESTIYVTCMQREDLNIGFRVDCDGVYWDVINQIVRQLGDRPEKPGKSAMSRFGTVPLRCSAPPRQEKRSYWTSMHSMHSPEEVKSMLSELRTVAPVIEAAKNEGVREQFRDALLPAIEQVANDERLLFIQVDT